MRLRSDDERVAMVSRFFVSQFARGGVGKLLLDQVIEWARERGWELVLEVDSTAVAAIGLYERLGWQRTGSYVADWTKPGGEPVTMLRFMRAA